MSIRVNDVNNVNISRQMQSKINFRGEEQTPVDIEYKPDTFEKECMSTGTKAAIGVGSLLALIAAGFGIKKGIDIKAANKVLKEAGEAVGIDDVKLYKKLKSTFTTVSKSEDVGYEEIIAKIQNYAKENKFTIEDKDSICIFSTKGTQDFLAANNIKGLKDTNSVIFILKSGDKTKYSEIINAKNLKGSFTDLFPEDKTIYVQDIKVV